MSYSDIRSMPVTYRKWFLRRLAEEFTRKSEARKENSQISDTGSSRTRQVDVDKIMDKVQNQIFKKFD